MQIGTSRNPTSNGIIMRAEAASALTPTSTCTPARRRTSSANNRPGLALLLLLLVTSPLCSAAGYYTYQYDGAFNGGFPLDDRFANSDTNDYVAERLARAANGDVIVAGIVPAAYQSSGGNVGLVRYTSDGARASWSNPSAAYASYFNIYLTFPNSTGAQYTRVVDLKVQNGYIFALVDYAASPSESDVYVLVFGDDGTYIGEYASFTTTLDELGTGLVAYSFVDKFSNTQRRLIAIANYINGAGNSVMTLKRFSVSAGGGLTVDTGFGPYGNGANDIQLPSDRCDAGAKCDVRTSTVSAVAVDSVFPRVYVAASVGTVYSGASTSYSNAVIGIDGSNGGLLSGFGSQTSGIYYSTDYSGSGPLVIAATTQGALASDSIYLADSYSHCAFLSCSGSSRLGKLRAVSGLPPPNDGTVPYFSWGNGGSVGVDGGWPGFGFSFSLNALAVDSDRVVAVGGASALCVDASAALYDCGYGVMTSVTTDTGSLEGVGLIDALRAGETSWSFQSWADIIPGSTPGSFTVTGAMGGAPPNSADQFGTSQLVPLNEGIFRNSFE